MLLWKGHLEADGQCEVTVIRGGVYSGAEGWEKNKQDNVHGVRGVWRKIRIGLYFILCGVVFPIVLTDNLFVLWLKPYLLPSKIVFHMGREVEYVGNAEWLLGLLDRTMLYLGTGGLPDQAESVGKSQIWLSRNMTVGMFRKTCSGIYQDWTLFSAFKSWVTI